MKPDPMRVWLTRLSLGAGIAFTATAEYQLASKLGASPVIAAMLPLAIDAYVVAALRWFRAFDIALSLALMGAAQVAAHLLDADLIEVDILLVTIVSLLVPTSIWRTHALARPKPETSGIPDTAEPPAVTVERAPAPPTVTVPRQVHHHIAPKPYKAALPPAPAPAPEPRIGPEPEPSAVDVLARQHKVKPEQIRTVAELLTVTPDLSGKAAGEAIQRGDRYGRRVLTAARELKGVRT